MGNHFQYAFENKRYHTWSYHLKNKLGQKISKVALGGGFDCPNRDDIVAHGGCTFCSAAGSGDFAGNRADLIAVQFKEIKKKMHEKWHEGKYIAYFQAFTNTHAPVEVLKEKFEPVPKKPGVAGLSIGTRPDCLPDDVVEYLADSNQRTYSWVELGLQTIHQSISDLTNRAHDMQTYYDGVIKLRKHNINVYTHIINGLPGEDYDMMVATAKEVAQMDVQGIKIHLLHLLKGAPMVKQYDKGLLTFMTQEEYTNLVVDQLEVIPPEMIVHRITGGGPIDITVGPMWSVNKWEVLNGIDVELARRNSYQGLRYKSKVKQ